MLNNELALTSVNWFCPELSLLVLMQLNTGGEITGLDWYELATSGLLIDCGGVIGLHGTRGRTEDTCKIFFIFNRHEFDVKNIFKFFFPSLYLK
jgi:hypothetical protein